MLQWYCAGPQFKPQSRQKENLSQVQSEQYHYQSLCTTVKYLKLSEVKTRSHHSAVRECRTLQLEVPSSNPDMGKEKFSHRSNQNNATTNPSAPQLNTSNCQRWKPEVAMAQWYSAGLEIHRSPVQIPLQAERKISHRSNQNNTTTNPAAPVFNT